MPEAKPPTVQEIDLHVVRTGRDPQSREVSVEYRKIWVTQGGAFYYPNPDDLAAWEWAFGPARSVPMHERRKGYTRYYDTDKDRLFRDFLESRKKAVESARAALAGAEQILVKAETFCQEVENG